MHPVENIRGSVSRHLAGRHVVLGVCGSIGAVKCVELARELIRHGAQVTAVMTPAATRILHPDALHFATGRPPILALTGAVEHVALLGDVPGKADLLLVAPATANTVAKLALGIDDSTVTTCATVAFGTKTPVVVAPAMHEAMLEHPLLADHQKTLVQRLGVTWVEPRHEEKKAKLADVDAIVEAVIHRLASEGPKTAGPLAGKACLVVTGATWEAIDDVRVLTNRSSGESGRILATELCRLGADVTVWQAHPRHTFAAPVAVEPFETVEDLLAKVASTRRDWDMIWMPAAIGDYAPGRAEGKLPSEKKALELTLHPLPKVIEALRKRSPKAFLVAFKAEATSKGLETRARERLRRYKAQAIVANAAASFGAENTQALLVLPKGKKAFSGPKSTVLAALARELATRSAR